MLSLMLFLDCSSDHWKYEKLLLCYCKAYGVTTAVKDWTFFILFIDSVRLRRANLTGAFPPDPPRN